MTSSGNEADRPSIHIIRGRRVMLDRDIAALYGVPTIALRQQVRRNKTRFPPDFMMTLTRRESESLVSQSVIPSRRSLGGSAPLVFTQEGVAMLSGILRSPRAIAANIAIMRAFARYRRALFVDPELARRLGELERQVAGHDGTISQVLEALRDLIGGRETAAPRRIGFQP